MEIRTKHKGYLIFDNKVSIYICYQDNRPADEALKEEGIKRLMEENYGV